MNTTSQRFANIVVQGWTMMFLVFLANLSIDMIKCSVVGDCTAWSAHIGIGGVKLITVIMMIYTVVPMMVRTVSARWIRYAVLPVTMFITLFYIAHELSHRGDKPFGIYHALDITHHILGVWVLITAVRWIRLKDQLKEQFAS
jgi:hypothetical protein